MAFFQLLNLSGSRLPLVALVLALVSSTLVVEGQKQQQQRTVQFGSLRIPVKGRMGSVNAKDDSNDEDNR